MIVKLIILYYILNIVWQLICIDLILYSLTMAGSFTGLYSANNINIR